MAESYTPRMGVRRWTDDGDTFTRDELDLSFQNLEARAAIFGDGALSERPAAGVQGRFYVLDGSEPNAALRGQTYYDNGTGWTLVQFDLTAVLATKANVAHSHALAELPVAANTEVSATKLVRADDARLVTERLAGEIVMWGGTALPNGWAWCDGASYTTAAQPTLFSKIGYTHGGGGGNFSVPNMNDRFPIGRSGSKAAGTTGGSDSKTLLSSHLPSHSHSMSHAHAMAHYHGMSHDHTMAHNHSMAHDHTISNHNHAMNHSHTIDHDHGPVNSGGRSADHQHYVSLGGGGHEHVYSFPYNRTVANGAATGADSSSYGAGTAGGGGHGHEGWSGGENVDHVHSVDIPYFSGSSGGASNNTTTSNGGQTTSGSSAASTGGSSAGSTGYLNANTGWASNGDYTGGSTENNTGATGVSNPPLDVMNPWIALPFIIKL